MKDFNKDSAKFLMEESLPHNFLAEKMILSCLILDSEAIELTQKNLIVDAFYFKNHQSLYTILLKMKEKELPIDIVTLTTFLQDQGLLPVIGGIKVLLDLGNQLPTFSYLNEYIRIVKEKFLKRCLIKLGYTIVNSGYITNQSLETIISSIEQDLFELTNLIRPKTTSTMAHVLNELFSELKERFINPKLPGLASGFSELDKLTQGFQKSDLIIIAGRPSMGKTALSLTIALNCIKISRLPILFCSLEMSKQQILYRFLSSETGINQMKLKNGQLTQNDWIKLNKIMRIIAKLPFFINDTSSLSVQQIRSEIKKILVEQNELGLVIIDYLQLMQGLDLKQSNRVYELSQITRGLKNLAREFNIPIIALSQLSRNVDNRMDQRPVLSDLRESGSIEQDADLVLMLSRSKSNYSINSVSSISRNELPVTELILAKQRNGPIGSINLKFNENRIKFSNVL